MVFIVCDGSSTGNAIDNLGTLAHDKVVIVIGVNRAMLVFHVQV